MPETASSKTVTETVAAANKNMVKLALDEYNDLVRKAARPVVNNVTVLKMTNEQFAKNSMLYGGLLAITGGVILVGGILINRSGRSMLK